MHAVNIDYLQNVLEECTRAEECSARVTKGVTRSGSNYINYITANSILITININNNKSSNT